MYFPILFVNDKEGEDDMLFCISLSNNLLQAYIIKNLSFMDQGGVSLLEEANYI